MRSDRLRLPLVLLALLAAPLGAQSGINYNVSSDANGALQGGATYFPCVSDDGRFVAFSAFSALLPSDTDNDADVYVRDLHTDTLEIVSLTGAGLHLAAAAGHQGVAISGDGRYVAFTGNSTAYATPNPTASNLFVRDRLLGATVAVPGPTGGPFRYPDLSADGRYIAFNITGGSPRIFHADLVLGTWEHVTVVNGPHPICSSYAPAISGDGRFVAFETCDPTMVGAPPNAGIVWRIYRRDTVLDTTELISVDSSGTPANGHSGHGAYSGVFPGQNGISDDGRYVVFTSLADNLVPSDTNGAWDIFVRDVQLGTTLRVSEGAGGVQANASSSMPAISGDGRYVVFVSGASNLVPGVSGAQIYRHDTVTGENALVTANSAGGAANAYSDYPAVTMEGRRVVFRSLATNLGPFETGLTNDVFVHDLDTTLEQLGSTSLGATITWNLSSPADAGTSYVMGSSFGFWPGIPIDARRAPLNFDLLLVHSTSTPSVFVGYVGSLDAFGGASASAQLPFDPQIVGTSFYTSFLTVDPMAASGVSGISNTVAVTVLP